MSDEQTLVLNGDGNPLEVVSWQQAVSMVLRGKAYVLEEYEDRPIRTINGHVPRPCVVAKYTYTHQLKAVKYSPKGVRVRDNMTCMYCGFKARFQAQLTMDHVVPRSRSNRGWVVQPWSGEKVRVTGWRNIVACCEPCNRAKADRTPAEANMPLLNRPGPPSSSDRVKMALRFRKTPPQWDSYLR